MYFICKLFFCIMTMDTLQICIIFAKVIVLGPVA